MSISATRALLTMILLIAIITPALCEETGAGGDPEPGVKSSFVFFPILFYTPETKFGAGASFVYYFRSAGVDSTDRPSTISPFLIYTQENQIVATLGTDIYWNDDINRLVLGIGYVNFPSSFYGVGPNTTDSMVEDYTPETFLFDAGFYRRVKSSIRLGLRYEFRHSSILEREEGGLLDPGTIPGSRGGDVSGMGCSVSWDTRDNVFYPSGGSYYHTSAVFFDDKIASDFAFNRYFVELRKYISLGPSSMLAFRGAGHFSSGVAPFQMMATYGGQNQGRGFYGERFRDKHSLVAQTEFRWRILKRWGLVLFGGAGAVAHELDAFELDEAKPSGGFGIRYLYNADEGINVRLDFGFAKDSSGVYITAGEAF